MNNTKYLPILFITFLVILYSILIQNFPFINDDEFYPIVMAKKYLSLEGFSISGMTYYTSSLFNITLLPLQILLEDTIFASRLTNILFLIAASFLSYKHNKSWATWFLITLTPTFYFFTVNSLEAIGLMSLLVMLGLFFLDKNKIVSSIFFGVAVQLHIVSAPALILFFTKNTISKKNIQNFLIFLVPTILLNIHKVPAFLSSQKVHSFSFLNHLKLISFLFDGSLFSQILIQQLNTFFFLAIILLTLSLGLIRKRKESLILIFIFLLISLISPEFPRVTYWCFYFFLYYTLISSFLSKKELKILFTITIAINIFYTYQFFDRFKQWPQSAKGQYLHSDFIPQRSINYKKLNKFILQNNYHSILVHEPNFEILTPYAIYFKEIINPTINADTTHKNKWRFTQYKSTFNKLDSKSKTIYLSTKEDCPRRMKKIHSPLQSNLIYFCESI